MISKHINLSKSKNNSSWRKVAINSWKRPSDPSTFGLLKLDATKFKDYLTDHPGVSQVELFTKVISNAIAEHPQVNAMVVGNKVYLRSSVDIFLQVAVDGKGEELSGTVIRGSDKKSVVQISTELKEAAKNIRSDNDEGFKKVKKSLSIIPSFLTRIVLNILDFILYRLNIFSPFLGVQPDPFGSCMITSVSSFGVDHGFVPIPAISRIPLIFALFDINEEVVVENGEIVVKPMLTVSATLDHRVIDGVYGAKVIKSIKEYMEQIDKF